MSRFFTKIKVENPKSLYILVNIFKTLNSHEPWTCAKDTKEIEVVLCRERLHFLRV